MTASGKSFDVIVVSSVTDELFYLSSRSIYSELPRQCIMNLAQAGLLFV